MRTPDTGFLFVTISVIFLAVTLRDYLRGEDKLTPARRTWLRIAFIFAGVGIGLHLLRLLIG